MNRAGFLVTLTVSIAFWVLVILAIVAIAGRLT